MGQPRTALILGAKTNAKLGRFLRSDLAHEKFHTAEECTDLTWHTDSEPQLVGFAFAVAYDPPKGCAELKLPVRLDDAGSGRLSVAYNRAMKKWVRFIAHLKKFHIAFDVVPEVFLGEVERA